MISSLVTETGRVRSGAAATPRSEHTRCEKKAASRGVHDHRQRTDAESIGGSSDGVVIGVKPSPRIVTVVPPPTGPPVGSTEWTAWRYCPNCW